MKYPKQAICIDSKNGTTEYQLSSLRVNHLPRGLQPRNLFPSRVMNQHY